jgi:hypothetical protein
MNVINPGIFSGLLFNMAGQYFSNNYAYCTNEEDFANQLSKDAQDFFTIVVQQCDELGPHDVFGILRDNTTDNNADFTFTLIILINNSRFHGVMPRINLAVIFSHEICHFAFYYEFFMLIKGKNKIEVFNKFRDSISATLKGSVKTYKFDNHVLPVETPELIVEFSNFPNEHFTQRRPSEIEYKSFFLHFLDYLNLRFLEG